MEYNDSFLNAKEVSKHLRIPLRTVYRLTKDGKIKAVKIGKQWRYKRTDIENYFSFGTNFSREPARKLNDFIERRACPRINTDFDCQYLINLPRFRVISNRGIVKNLSTNGVLVICQNDKIETGDPIGLKFMDIMMEGRVVRKIKNELGIKFRSIKEEDKMKIIKYIG